MSKIKKITVSNLKAVSALTADFNGCTAIITGGNNKGKSSFLKALPERIRGNKPECVLKHNEEEGFSELELTSGEKFIWKFGKGKKEILTFISERNIKSGITKEIGNLYFPKTFDVDAFLNDPPKEQKKILQKLTGIDFYEFDLKYKEAYDERTFRNKQMQIEEAKMEPYDKDLPKEPIPTESIEQELAGIEAHNLRYKNVEDGIKAKELQIHDNLDSISELLIKLQALKDKNAVLEQEVAKGELWKAADKNKPKENRERLKEQLADVKNTNKKIEANNLHIKQEAAFIHAKQLAKGADAEVKRLEAEKADVIKNASMPEGFGFSDDGITYMGFEFTKEQLSTSRIYIGALKLAALQLGEVKTLHFDASSLDKASLEEIEVWAKTQSLQLLIERPDWEGGEIEYQIMSV